MHTRGGSSTRGQSGLGFGSRVSSLFLAMFATMATIYVAGRLWQDAETRLRLVEELDKITGQGKSAVSVDDTLKIIACREQQKKLSAVETELAAARQAGFVSKKLVEKGDGHSKKRILAVIGIITTFGRKKNRDAIRKAWMPTGAALKKLEDEKGIVLQFVIGRSPNHGDSLDREIDNENRQTNDFIVLDGQVEAIEEQPKKSKLFFIHAVETWDAEFYAKVNDDVYVNIDALGATLSTHLDKPRAYIGCMKSGEVFSEPTQKWYEPDWWKFGDGKSYFRHASGEIYAISRALAQFISINRSILRSYAHDDVSTGSWFIGLDVKHVDESKFCCSSWSTGSISRKGSLFTHPLSVFLVPDDRHMNSHAMHLVRVDPDCIKIVKLLVEEDECYIQLCFVKGNSITVQTFSLREYEILLTGGWFDFIEVELGQDLLTCTRFYSHIAFQRVHDGVRIFPPVLSDLRAAAAVEVAKDRNGVDQVVLRNRRGASARVSLHGGQVLSWRTDQGEELLFTSSKAIFKPPNPVRGGIPICFPQFGNRGSLEQHGFARKKFWVIDQNPPPFFHHNDFNDKVSTDLLLKPSEEDLKIWPHSFEFRLRVCLTAEGNLTMISRIRNISCKPFNFSIAFHTYLSISDISSSLTAIVGFRFLGLLKIQFYRQELSELASSEVRVEGLETLDYLDNLCQKERFTEQGNALTFESEVDRVYLSSSDVVAVFDHERKMTFTVRKEGLPDVVVWNPWEKKSKSMVDFGDEEYKQMLCVDGAAIEKPITLKTGEEWTGRLELSGKTLGGEATLISEPGFDPGTCGLWAHHASAAPL
ncbi:unnamed protein product [Dovyalis caffra]|uniref:glucose-6-phosphate 1-epimerase n=1 Tax=Dovyalis caffra TaxID=77055 RepID=A0AAV1RKB6_9ROSI|nr:unnamed protein product [Dovyalis caffra]